MHLFYVMKMEWYNTIPKFFCVWLFSLHVMFSGFIYLVACVRISFFYGWILFHCMGIPHFLYPFTCQQTYKRHVTINFFQLCCVVSGLAVVKNDAASFCVQVSAFLFFSSFGHILILCLTFFLGWGTGVWTGRHSYHLVFLQSRLVLSIFKIGSHELFGGAGLKLRSSWSLPPE
jgi:hypothetical protein